MVYVTGDTHADFSRFSFTEFPEQCDMTTDDITLAFRGSTNQRIIDVKKTLAANEIVELQIE